MDRFDYLKSLFDLLPDTFPSPQLSDSEFSRLDPFELEPNLLTRTEGDVPEAVSQHLHAIFYADGEIRITERGPVVSTVVQVLKTYLQEFPHNRKLLQWREHLIKALEGVLQEHGIMDHPGSMNVVSDASTHREEMKSTVGIPRKRKWDSKSDDDEPSDAESPETRTKDVSSLFDLYYTDSDDVVDPPFLPHLTRRWARAFASPRVWVECSGSMHSVEVSECVGADGVLPDDRFPGVCTDALGRDSTL